MVHFPVIPRWFVGYNIGLEFAFAIVAFLVSIYAYKVYKLSSQRRSRLLSIGFIFISLSYVLRTIINFSIIAQVSRAACTICILDRIADLTALGAYGYIFFFITGLVTLAYMTMNIDSIKTYVLLLLVTAVALLGSANMLYMFHLLSSIFLIYVTAHFITAYFRKRGSKTLLVVLAFAFLLFGSIHFIIAVNHSVFYVIGNFLELIAYALILVNLLWILRWSKEKGSR